MPNCTGPRPPAGEGLGLRPAPGAMLSYTTRGEAGLFLSGFFPFWPADSQGKPPVPRLSPHLGYIYPVFNASSTGNPLLPLLSPGVP